jgi:zinc protease
MRRPFMYKAMRAVFCNLAVSTFCMAVLIGYSATVARAQSNPIVFSEYNLPNGLHVILHQDKSAPIVATALHYRVGSRDENPQRTGFAHFFEHLMFEGTKDIPRKSVDKYIETAGGRLNAYTALDQTVYVTQLPANQLQLSLYIESQRMRSLVVDSVGVQTQRGVVKEERKVRYDNQAYGSFLEKALNNLFRGGSYSWPGIGSSQHIDSAKISEFQAFYNNFYQPNNATLAVSGDFDEKQAKEWIQAYFGGLPKAKEPQREAIKITELSGEIRERIDDPKAQVPAIFWAYRGPKDGSDDFYAVKLLQSILFDGESSRMYQRLVDKEQVAVEIAEGMIGYQHTGLSYIVGIAAPGKSLDSVEIFIDEEINKAIASGVTDAELSKAKNIKEAQLVFGKKGAMDKAETLAKNYSFFGNTNLINTEMSKYLKVTKADIQRVAQQYFGGKRRVALAYFPAQAKK